MNNSYHISLILCSSWISLHRYWNTNNLALIERLNINLNRPNVNFLISLHCWSKMSWKMLKNISRSASIFRPRCNRLKIFLRTSPLVKSLPKKSRVKFISSKTHENPFKFPLFFPCTSSTQSQSWLTRIIPGRSKIRSEKGRSTFLLADFVWNFN